MTTIKKYSNRRLYDTDLSRYITLDELAAKIREGGEVRVVDAKTGEDLTQTTLTQLILEGPTAKLLPVGLLHRLLRMQEDAIAEFFSSYVTWALDGYLAARGGAQQLAPLMPFSATPWSAASAMAEFFARSPFGPGRSEPRPPPAPAEAGSSDHGDEIRALREELEALKRTISK